jgi:hypothetical protein
MVSLGLLTILYSVLCLTYLDCLYFQFATHNYLSYSAKISIKNQLDKWRRKETTDRHISPLGLMCLQGEEMKIDVKNIEEEFQFHGLQASKSV